MLVHIPHLLAQDEVAAMQSRLEAAPWADGRLTAGHQSALAKTNLQLPQEDAAARALGEEVLRALEKSPRFISATLPRRVYPPLFNRYDTAMSFGAHVDNAIRQIPGTPHRMRTDISATLFLSAPEQYDGGELIIEDTYGTQSVKHAAGDLVVYPATSVHRVLPVTRGTRTAAFFLDSKHGARRRRPRAPVRYRQRRARPDPHGRARRKHRAADGLLPQSVAPLGRRLSQSTPPMKLSPEQFERAQEAQESQLRMQRLERMSERELRRLLGGAPSTAAPWVKSAAEHGVSAAQIRWGRMLI